MNEYARIVDGVVTSILTTHKTLTTSTNFRDVTGAGIEIGQTWDGMAYGPAPAPPARTQLSVLEFREQFTQTEKRAIYAAAKVDGDVEIFLDDLRSAEFVELTDARTVAAVSALETAGLIGPGRAAEILAGIS